MTARAPDWLRALLAVLALIAAPGGPDASAQQASLAQPRVEVVRRESLFVIDATMIAPVAPAQAWEVLTDFDAMSRFLPDLESSRVVARKGDLLTIEQNGVMRWGPLSQRFKAVREVELTPISQVSSKLVSGTLSAATTRTRLAAVADGTEIRHHIELELDSWLPDAALAALLRHETRQQFAALLDEMRRRVAGQPVRP